MYDMGVNQDLIICKKNLEVLSLKKMAMSSSRGNGKSRKNLNYEKTFLMPGFWNGEITNWAVKSSVAIETLESNQSHYIYRRVN
jgi:hypothetical protein